MRNDRIWNGEFSKIFIVNLFNAMGFHILTPILPKYAVALGYSTTIAGVIGTAFTLTAVLVRCFTGFLANERRQQKMLLGALALISTASSGYAFVARTGALVAFRLLHGIGWGMTTTLTATMAVRALPADKVGSGIGIFGLASVLGQAIAPNLGLTLVKAIGYAKTFLAAAALPLAALAVSAAFCPNAVCPDGKKIKRRQATGKEQLNAYAKAWRPVLLIFLVTIGVSCVSYFLALDGESRGMEGVGMFFTIYAFALLLIRPIFGRLADRIRSKYIFGMCALALIASFLLLAVTNRIEIWYFVAVLYAIGYGGAQPALQSWCVQSVPPQHTAFANSAFYSCFDLGICLGAVISGALADRWGYAMMYVWMCVPFAIAIVVALSGKNRPVSFQAIKEEAL